jgi:hypothetical protein
MMFGDLRNSHASDTCAGVARRRCARRDDAHRSVSYADKVGIDARGSGTRRIDDTACPAERGIRQPGRDLRVKGRLR